MAAGNSEKQHDPELEQAFDWLLRVEQAPDDADLQRSLDAWKAADARHAAAWRRAREIWGLIGEVPPDCDAWPDAPKAADPATASTDCQKPVEPAPADPRPAAAVPVAADDRHKRRRRRRRSGRVAMAATAAVAVCMLVLLWPKAYLHMTADYVTGVGETRQVTLEDGSVAHLAAGSAISVDYSAERRSVRLLSGRAFFDVAANPERPFVVDASQLKITVLGTAFDVQMGQKLYIVTVQRGSVAVQYAGGREAFSKQLTPGQQLRIARNGGATMLAHVSPAHVAAWRDGRLFVRSRTIAGVAAILQRYYHGYIFIADDTLGQSRVTGSYRLDDIDRALSGLVKPYHGRIRELTPFVRILHPS